jgi:hypothetical protein
MTPKHTAHESLKSPPGISIYGWAGNQQGSTDQPRTHQNDSRYDARRVYLILGPEHDDDIEQKVADEHKEADLRGQAEWSPSAPICNYPSSVDQNAGCLRQIVRRS